MSFNRDNLIERIKRIDINEVKYFIIKEFSKFILIPLFFMLISPLLTKLFRSWYGLEEYLKHETLRLFVSSYYIDTAIFYGHSSDVYFNYITNKLDVELYLWIIPYSIAIIYCYIAYVITHKIVDRTGIGATQKLNFFYFFFIFATSNILFRILMFDYNISYMPYPIMWYLIYKILKISVLKIKEKMTNKGEEDVKYIR